jgi:hypothetical protein
VFKARVDFLWYKKGQEISSSELSENVDKWLSMELIEGFEKKASPVIVEKEEAVVSKSFGKKKK